MNNLSVAWYTAWFMGMLGSLRLIWLERPVSGVIFMIAFFALALIADEVKW